MKNHKILLVCISIVFSVLLSCSDSRSKSTTTNNKVENNAIKPVINAPEVTKSISVKKTAKGNKSLWIANKETTNGIYAMRKRMTAFSDKENNQSYKKLKGQLESEFMGVLTNCTMTGDALYDLREYLTPIKDSFNGLASDDLNVCKKSFDTLNKQLNAYENYFE